MNLLREYIKKLLVEWEPANDRNLMLDQEGMEKSDRENVSQYLKSLGLLESITMQPPHMTVEPRTSSVFPGDRFEFPDIPYPPIDSFEGEEDLAKTILQYDNRVVPAELQKLADVSQQELFKMYLDHHGLTFNESYFRKLRVDLLPIIKDLKDYYGRLRPHQVAQLHGIDFVADPLTTVESPSYPSGHTIQGYVVALKLAEQFPEHTENLLKIAELISQSRIDRGVHFPSDVDFGRIVAYIIADEMKDGSN